MVLQCNRLVLMYRFLIHADRLGVFIALMLNPLTWHAEMPLNGLVPLGQIPRSTCAWGTLYLFRRQRLAGRSNYCSIHLLRSLLSAGVDDSYVALQNRGRGPGPPSGTLKSRMLFQCNKRREKCVAKKDFASVDSTAVIIKKSQWPYVTFTKCLMIFLLFHRAQPSW